VRNGTVFFAAVESLVLTPMIWPHDGVSARALLGVAGLVVVSLICGYAFSAVTWIFLRGWFEN
jgi:hypothetical protein